MSMHKVPLTRMEEAGLLAHGLDIGVPSQLSDVFRQGVKWAMSHTPEPETEHQLNATDATMDNLILVIQNIQRSLIAANKPNGPIMDTIWLSDDSSETLFDYIEAALQTVGAPNAS